LFQCWSKAKQNKSNNLRVQRFDQDPLRHLVAIQQRLRAGAYDFGPYKTFVVREKKWRDVVDAPMKDRVVHWMLYQHLLPIWQPRLIDDTYGNLPLRGTHAAVRRVAQFARGAGAQWVLQLDISKYFYSVQHDLLKVRALRYIGDQRLRELIVRLVGSFRTGAGYDHLFAEDSAYRRTAAKGMPIGALSSQLFANIYLADFDRWVKQELGVRRYVRYVDDLVVLGADPDELRDVRAHMVARLAEDGLTIRTRCAWRRPPPAFHTWAMWYGQTMYRLAPTSVGATYAGYASMRAASTTAARRCRPTAPCWRTPGVRYDQIAQHTGPAHAVDAGNGSDRAHAVPERKDRRHCRRHGAE
jgi:retron-type reverse transcriptase